ncbi:tRNA-specific adenosine deaminase [Candidatus Marinamargulisbacteria bacterium SCGC AG-343-D04]|nr:tRNA-specific adenosine deaminase [Candidatus Marinamargulisbacteria bacterium SCGC AG-343-D04]
MPISFLEHAYQEAEKAYQKNEVPIGCVIVQNNRIIAAAHNEKETRQDCTEHAEIRAIKLASSTLNQWRLLDCDLYSTCEPCLMCASAIIHARIKTVFYGVSDSKWGGETQFNIFSKQLFNHTIKYEYIPHEKSKTLLQQFFKEKRTA